jgi:UDP-3-O-[3-hydroxymyristoyl] glucosamine N-acyltransferase
VNATLAELAELTGGVLVLPEGIDPQTPITGIAALADATERDVAFFNNDRYAADLESTRAGALLVDEHFPSGGPLRALIVVPDPSRAFAEVARKHVYRPPQVRMGIHPSAWVAEGVILDPEKVSVGPQATVEEGCVIGDGTMIGPGVVLSRGCKIGENCRVHANSVLFEDCVLGNHVFIHGGCVIGASGFGYETTGGKHQPIEQIGYVQLDDFVEVGAGTTIDRARFGRTWIGEGTKIDNLVQIGHNAVIGKHCIIVALCGIAGSACIGDNVTIAAFTGVAGHIRVGSNSLIAARTGVTKSLPAGGQYMGYPAAPIQEVKRRLAGFRRLPEILSRLLAMEKRFKAIDGDDSGSLP